MTETIKPYVIFLSQNHPARKFAFDRLYTRITKEWEVILDLRNLVQVEFFIGCPYPGAPNWVEMNEPLIAMWTNYYD